ncbi:GntR family transcriptional regulator [Salinarimonas soli]|uniref:GntR family transcriptional regulator n=1 Tax=Salinarimonas soli TaxID=1638099 RepID=A0A5B2VA51_9HYPH|nr:GntR family transcriptional regulator [Salinarimonas soli]KAA2235891.1 GntR family transcriptional regulator [Salinarimonas soli]
MDATVRSFTPLRDRSRPAAPQVFDVLRDEIISLTLPPGTVLNRGELQEQFGVSSTPIRDALLRLQEEGFVDIFPQHATVVSAIDLAAASQSQFLRRSVEVEVVRTLAETPNPDLVARLRSILARQEALAALGELDDFNTLDSLFHQTLYEAARVPDLWTIVRRNSGQIDRLRRLHLPVDGKARQIVADHAAILEAIAAGECDVADRALRAHLSRSLAFSAEMRTRHPGYFRD